jgi:predicted DCC family thiol-disulfide oxidoreductase YuxK
MPAMNWLLWDGDCGFCQHVIEWVQRRDRRSLLRAVPYQTAPSPPLTPALRRACARAVHVITADGETLRAGRACLFVLDAIGYHRTARLLRLPPLIWAVEGGYRLVARYRGPLGRLLFRNAACRTRL